MGVSSSLLFGFASPFGLRKTQPITFRQAGVESTNRRHEKKVHLDSQLGDLPLTFQENIGQADTASRFCARSSKFGLCLGSDSAVFSFADLNNSKPREDESNSTDRMTVPNGPVVRTVKMRMIGANLKTRLEGIDKEAMTANFFSGRDPRNWHVGVPSYRAVKYHHVFPRIDLEFYSNHENKIEYDSSSHPMAIPGESNWNFKARSACSSTRVEGSYFKRTPASCRQQNL